jgi:hypothetical protein
MWFMTLDIGALYIHEKPPQNPQENMGRLSIFGVLGDKKQEHLIDPLKGTTSHSKDLNLGGEGNNPSSQPPKLHPMDKPSTIVTKLVFENIHEIAKAHSQQSGLKTKCKIC